MARKLQQMSFPSDFDCDRKLFSDTVPWADILEMTTKSNCTDNALKMVISANVAWTTRWSNHGEI